MRIVYRPLPVVWPSGNRTPASARAYSRFKASYSATLNLLVRELRYLGVYQGDTVVFETGFQEHEIRLDGLPRRGAKPADPAIILSFESRYGPLRYGCDTYATHDANLRAIALALEALRAVDRYGVTKRGEQYQGWKALPAAGETMTARTAAIVIRDMAEVTNELPLADAARRAARKVHPDVGGTRELWDRLQRAREVLGV
jgi:hypothetical protein